MKFFGALLLILFLAFSGYHLTFRSFKLPLFAKKFYFTGTEYLFLGLLLGPFFFNLLDENTISKLEPLTAFLLGWIGFLFGFQFEIKELRRFSKKFFISALTEAIITFSMVFSAVFFLAPLYFNIPETTLIIGSIALASAASCTAQTGIALLTKATINKRSELILFLKYISSIDSIIALLFFAPVFFLNPHIMQKPSWFSTNGFEILAVFVANFCLILLYNLFLAQRRDKKELLLVITGMIILTSGAASTLHFSPLLANFAMGMFMVNTTREKERIFLLLVSIEKPVYLLLLVFIGAYWVPDSFIYILFAIIFCIVRLTGKFSGGFLAAKINYKNRNFPSGLGLGMIEQGGISLAILFDFQQGFSGNFTTQIVSFAIIAIIINDLISPLFIHRLLNRRVYE